MDSGPAGGTRPIKHLDIKEFRELGFLQEANRLFFHPHGLALEVRVIDSDWTDEEIAESEWMQARMGEIFHALRRDPEVVKRFVAEGHEPALDGNALEEAARAVCRALWPKGSQFLSGVWDYREDPEGVVFGDGETRANAERAAQERRRHYAARSKLFTGREDVPPGCLDVEPLDFVYEEDE
jgi:hypothetical protein